MNLVKRIICFTVFFMVIAGHSQEIPPIQIFSPQDYGAEDQNWSIDQSKNNFIYVANNSGLLEYNGAFWRLFKSPNNDILRSIKIVDEKIYSGGYMDFGYWSKNEYGNLLYTSLSNNTNLSLKEDEEFWGIINIEGYMLFQSLERIYIYNMQNEKFNVIDSNTRINKLFRVNEAVYFQKIGEGIFQIKNGKAELIISSDSLNNQEIINIYDVKGGALLQTKEDGFYFFNNTNISKWQIQADALLKELNVYSSIKLKDGTFILGTISNGIVQLDADGGFIQKIDQIYGLSNNTVLSLKEDANGNVWLGQDNGINVINLKSPYKVYTDKQGVLGTVYASEIAGSYLYLGTNQGLFYKQLDSNNQFRLVEGTKGQVWYLKFFKGTLFCGHDQGTFTIINNKASKISTEIGTWIIKEIKNEPNLLIQGNYKGLNVLEFKNGNWKYRNKIEGFDISSRYLEFSANEELLVNHEYKGVFKIKLDKRYSKVLDYEKMPVGNGIKSSVFTYNNSVYYCYEEGAYVFENSLNTSQRDSILSPLFSEGNYLSGKLINDHKNDRLWGFPKDEIIYLEPGKLTSQPEANSISIPNDIRKTKAGFENILHLDNNKYLIGTTNGYLVIDLDKIQEKPREIYLNSITHGSLHNEVRPVNKDNPISLKSKNNRIKFRYSVPSYQKLSNTKYQYRLKGLYDNWSQWSPNPSVFFENLPHGDYKFEARSITGGVLSSNVISYTFTIEKPWFLKPASIALYILFALGIGFLVHYFNKRYYKKQKQKLLEKKANELELEQLQNQRQLIQFKNKNLQLDIENKNRELGTATMNLVKRNELLNNIKQELSKSKSLGEVKSVIKMINSSLNNTSDWELFEEAFNNVDKDFMKRVKSLHPSITPNDLRLCAYLRLNLSSKEIAPLLNISHKSVEVKRYRLRKKMGLDHDQSLSDYIIEL